MKVVLALLILSQLSACALFDEAPRPQAVTVSQAEEGTSGIEDLEAGRYQMALDKFDALLQKNTVSIKTPNVIVHSGLALEGLGRYDDAEARFRSALRLIEMKDNSLQAETLFYLARVLDAQQLDDKSLAAFKDVERRANFLRFEISEVEVPARIAALYSRRDQQDMAEKYYKKAEKGLAKLRRTGDKNNLWIARSLYSMGKMTPRPFSEQDFAVGLKALKRSQSYLVRSIEYKIDPWDRKSQEEIRAIYDNAWSVIENTPQEEAEEKLTALRIQQRKMIEMGLVLNGALSELKQSLRPVGEGENPVAEKLHEYIDDYSKKLDALLVSRPVHEGLTPEAQNREGLLRQGRVINPVGDLETQRKKEEPEQPDTLPPKKKVSDD